MEKIFLYGFKRYGVLVDKVPENAHYIGEASGYVKAGQIVEDKRKGFTYYHEHMRGGSNAGKWGKHFLYRVED